MEIYTYTVHAREKGCKEGEREEGRGGLKVRGTVYIQQTGKK